MTIFIIPINKFLRRKNLSYTFIFSPRKNRIVNRINLCFSKQKSKLRAISDKRDVLKKDLEAIWSRCTDRIKMAWQKLSDINNKNILRFSDITTFVQLRNTWLFHIDLYFFYSKTQTGETRLKGGMKENEMYAERVNESFPFKFY